MEFRCGVFNKRIRNLEFFLEIKIQGRGNFRGMKHMSRSMKYKRI